MNRPESNRPEFATAPYRTIRGEAADDGRLAVVTLAAPPANILDTGMIEELRHAVAALREMPALRAVVIGHEGPHFSYGASVPEHLPGNFEVLIPAFHGLLRELVELNRPILAAVSGQVLGAGLELAAIAHRIFAAPGAKLGQPEIRLGVFAPAASAVLPLRVGQAAADDLLLSGRTLAAAEAAAIGLVDTVADDPAGAARAYAREHLLPKSASSLRLAVRAARATWRRRFLESLAEVENLYTMELMETDDAVEGLRSFLEKRPPRWSDR